MYRTAASNHNGSWGAVRSLARALDLHRLVFLLCFLSLLVYSNLSDPDYFWHLKTGEYIFAHGGLPSADVFSYTFAGRPWVLHEWLFEVVLFEVFRWSGPFGVMFLTALVGMLSLYVVYAFGRRVLGGAPSAVFLSLAFFLPLATGLSPRPQLVTYLLFAIYLYVLLDFKYFGSTRYLFALPVLMVVWVNMHGGYAIGLAVLGVFVVCEWANHWLGSSPDPAQKRRLSVLAGAALATVLASLLNPYLAGHWLYPFEVMNMQASKNFISEWQSPDFHEPVYLGYLLLVIGFLAANIFRQKKPDLTELVVPVSLIIASFSAMRHVAVASLGLAPFFAIALAQGGWRESPVAESFRRLRARYLKPGGGGTRQLGDAEYLLNWILLGLISWAAFAFYPVAQARMAERAGESVPVAAARFIADAGLTGRMFNSYRYGGYLIYRLYPAQKVFIDGRADVYGDEFIKEYMTIASGQAGWDRLFAKYDIDYVICRRDLPLRQLLLARGDFRLVYDDKQDSVLVRNHGKYAGIIARYGGSWERGISTGRGDAARRGTL